jgi:iron complex transport system substrate-binding protein
MTAPQRVVSLIPSATETVCALGLADRLVGRSHECDFPAEVGPLPILTRPKIDPQAASGEIDRQVRDLLTDALAVYDVDAERLRELAPDVVLTQDLCDVCAVSLADVKAALADWTGGAELVSLQPRRLDDLWSDIRRISEALGESVRGEALVEHLQGRLRRLEERLRSRARPKVGCIEWLDPIMDAGNWVPELVAAAGGRELLSSPGGHSGYLDWDRLRAADPDVLVMLPCGFDLKRTAAEMPVLDEDARWQGLAAVQSGAVFLTDGHQFFNRPGPRLIDSAELLAEIFHPDIVAPKHQGWGWQRHLG